MPPNRRKTWRKILRKTTFTHLIRLGCCHTAVVERVVGVVDCGHVSQAHIFYLHVREGFMAQGGLCDNAGESEHSEATVLNFLELHVGILGLAKVQGVEHVLSGLAIGAVEDHALDGKEGDGFDSSNPDKHLGHGAGLYRNVVSG